MTDSQSNIIKNEKESDPKNPQINLDGKTYDFNSLSDEVKELVRGVQIADTQIRMHQDALKLINLGKGSIIAQIKQKLEG
tara:strand:+ start:508 stop:747 length:240 start_codon:yes stop_codon:yes gene_type:complete